MNAKRPYRPALERVEDRIVLSFSFSHLVNSIFPGIDKPKVHHVAHSTVSNGTTTPHVHHHAHPHAHTHAIHAMKHKVHA